MHVGAPKTGTTYLQDRLGRNTRSLARHDVHIPSRSRFVRPGTFHFRAALDLLDQDWGGPPGHAEGAWDALVRRVRRMDGTVVISHEILAPAPPEKIALLKRDLAGSELHVVYSARDLARQAPAGWQESIKQGRRWTYNRYLNRVVRGRPWFAPGLRPAHRPDALGRGPSARARPRRHRAAGRHRRGRARPPLAPLLPGLRDRPGLGTRRQ